VYSPRGQCADGCLLAAVMPCALVCIAAAAALKMQTVSIVVIWTSNSISHQRWFAVWKPLDVNHSRRHRSQRGHQHTRAERVTELRQPLSFLK
jgi:hypothetical protein